MKRFYMKRISFIIILVIIIPFLAFKLSEDPSIVSFTADPKTQNIELFWKDDKGENLKSIQNLKTYIESKQQQLQFAMNGGMFNKDFSPKGLFIQKKNMVVPLDTSSGMGNFYLKPNGVFYLTTSNVPVVCQTSEFKFTGQINYATQSGPMLVINGCINPVFRKGSTNLNIRNGVGILPDSKIVLAISKKEISFYEFASFFKELGCKNALYLDGFVSRMYLPEKKLIQTDGNFGVIIGITIPK